MHPLREQRRVRAGCLSGVIRVTVERDVAYEPQTSLLTSTSERA